MKIGLFIIVGILLILSVVSGVLLLYGLFVVTPLGWIFVALALPAYFIGKRFYNSPAPSHTAALDRCNACFSPIRNGTRSSVYRFRHEWCENIV